MAVTKISARKATIKFITSAVTFDTATLLNAETYSTLTVVSCKNITLSKPISEVEQVPLIGETAKTIGSGIPRTGTFQNAIMDEKNFTNAVLTGTAVLKGDEDWELFATGTGTAITGGHTRYSYGDSTATTGARPSAGAILVDLNNGSEIFSAVLVTPYVNIGDIKLTGADGHFEVDFTATCLPEDYADEFKD